MVQKNTGLSGVFLLPKNRYFYLKVVSVLPILLLSTK